MSALALATPHPADMLQRPVGLGDVIGDPSSPRLIDGVRVEAATIWPDDRGHFQEVFRFGRGLVEGFPAATTQISVAHSFPGTVKAFHIHQRQTDCWAPLAGLFQVGLVDLRPESPTFGRRNTLYLGEWRPWRLLIPPGVAHGYKVVGPSFGLLVYATDRFYDPSDEGRISWDHPGIAYDWSTQRK